MAYDKWKISTVSSFPWLVEVPMKTVFDFLIRAHGKENVLNELKISENTMKRQSHPSYPSKNWDALHLCMRSLLKNKLPAPIKIKASINDLNKLNVVGYYDITYRCGYVDKKETMRKYELFVSDKLRKNKKMSKSLIFSLSGALFYSKEALCDDYVPAISMLIGEEILISENITEGLI